MSAATGLTVMGERTSGDSIRTQNGLLKFFQYFKSSNKI